MSCEIITKVLHHCQAPSAQKLALVAIAHASNRQGEARISLAEIAAICGVSEQRASVLVNSLEKSLLIEKTSTGGGHHKTNEYRIKHRAETKIPQLDNAGARNGAFAVDEVASETKDEEPLSPQKQDWNEFEPVVSQIDVEAPKKSADVADPPRHPHVTVDKGINHTTPVQRDQGAAPSAADVIRVLAAAGVQPPGDQPLYWSRREHQQDLAEILVSTGKSVDEIIASISAARAEGKELGTAPTRLSHLAPLYGGAT